MAKLQTLRNAREKLGKTQAAIAFALGMKKQTYQKYEYGIQQPRAHLATRVARALNSTVEELWGDEAETSKPA